MNTETALQPEVIKNTIYDIRGQKVMLDYDHLRDVERRRADGPTLSAAQCGVFR